MRRPATDEHLARDETNRRRRAEGRAIAKRLIRKHELPMKVIGVDYLDTDNVFKIYFTAPHRVDFRALVRDLARGIKARVELRQVGPRDEARLQGGIGPCGRDLCCATFLKDFEPVSVRMAKEQDLPVNPLRIAGACGRLMCCLKYEHPLYVKAHERMPPWAPASTARTAPARSWAATSPRTRSPSASIPEAAAPALRPRSAPRKQHDAMHNPASDDAG